MHFDPFTGLLLPPPPSSADPCTLLVLDPGHFHAALTLRRTHALLNDDVYVYAEPGPDVDAFVDLVESFNVRAEEPTHWKLHVYRGADYVDRCLSERRGEVAVIASRNDRKLRHIDQLHAAGIYVLGDKPWLIEPAQLDTVRAISLTPPLAMDIMTERHDVANRLQMALLTRAGVFGEFRCDDSQPALEMKSTHHLYKLVNGRPLVRPEWYFDVRAQGEGITDVTTHLVDLTQWLIGREALHYSRDVELVSARQWATEVPLPIYTLITGRDAFPESVRGAVRGDALSYMCNAEINYRLRGVPVHVESVWALEIPKGGGDQHSCIARGERADLVIEQSAATRFVPELFVRPREPSTEYGAALGSALATLQPQFPGIALDPVDGGAFHIRIPVTLRTTHEQHFALVLDRFLSLAARGERPERLISDLVGRYSLLAEAVELARRQAESTAE
jgi:predicted dehydrogenase